ncbi:MAG: UbiA family prenyltransferase [Bacteroidetes bacterium]|nr:UbiA family prenyltransferase [Bacteroidota bacterium]MBS1628621.1 UbiA family prenyltransferase [Bacteroidota bacterium]
MGHYLSLIKFSHTVFALPFALIGFVLGMLERGHGWPWVIFLKMLLCMVLARSAAMAFNRWLDRHYDARNPRTASREIPAGIVKPGHALLFTMVCCLLFMAVTATINRLVFFLSPVALFVILFYSYTKRFTSLCHLVLGLGLSLAPIGAFLCLHPVFSGLPLMFSGMVLTWVGGFDIIYALQDVAFDRSQQLHSIPARLGLKGALIASSLLHLITAALVLIAGFYGDFHFVYWLGAGIFTGLLLYQHLIVKTHDLSRVNMAFANTNGLASILFAVFTISALLLSF